MSQQESTAAARSKTEHFAELDGVRGCAAFIVMFGHFFYFCFTMRDDDPHIALLASSPFSLLLSGQYSVAVFFVLSGFVLAHATTRSRLGFGRLLVKRYVRLTIPIAASTFFALILFWLGLGSDAYRADLSQEASNYFPQNFHPTLWYWMYETVARVYITGESKLTAVLWTMRVELIGSILVFAVFRFVTFRNIRLIGNLIGATAMFLFLSKHSGLQGIQLFCCGMVIYDLWSWIRSVRETPRLGNILGWFLVLLGAAEAAWWVKDPLLPSVGQLFDLIRPTVQISRYEAWQMGAIITVAGVLFSRQCARVFATPVFRFLGLISFPLYITHSTIEVMVVGHLFVALRDVLPIAAAVAITCAVNIVLCLAVAWLLVRWVELPSIRMSNLVGNWQPKLAARQKVPEA